MNTNAAAPHAARLTEQSAEGRHLLVGQGPHGGQANVTIIERL